MLTFREFLNERFLNLIHDESEKTKYADAVWDILQVSYASIGGIKGSGFKDKEDMIKNIPFWKLVVFGGEVHGVALYKDRNGRKLVASGFLEGSERGRMGIVDIVKNDLERSYGEKSKGALGLLMKTIPWETLKNFMLVPKKSSKIIPISELDPSEIPEDGVFALTKFPHLRPYAYVRLIGDDYVFKVSMGTPGNTIK